MHRFKKILFYADGSRGQKSALGVTMDLAEEHGAALTVMDVVPLFSSNDDTLKPNINRLQDAIVEERCSELEEIVKDLKRSRNLDDVGILLVPGDKDFIEVIKQVVFREHDLLIKAGERTSVITSRMFGNTDMRFIRQCPCPVAILKSGHRRLKRVLAAVDLSDDSESTLHNADRIVRLATGLATRKDAKVHVLSVHENLAGLSNQLRADSPVYQELNKGRRQELRSRFENFASRYEDRNVEFHLLTGQPHKVIAEFVTDHEVDLLAMGTLASTTTPGLLIGSTAESVFHSVNCSVLTLKPEDFTTIIAQQAPGDS